MAAPKLKMRLGDLLVHEHIITNEQLMQALNSQKSTGRKLGDTLIELGYIGERQLQEFLAQQLNVPFLDISQRFIQSEVALLLPEVHARRLRALIIEDQGGSVLLGMSDPADLSGIDQLEQMLAPKKLNLAVVMESQLYQAFDALYRRTADIESFASQLEEEYEQTTDFDLSSTFLDDSGDATVGKLLQSVFEDAVQMRASDIHIEPDEKLLRIRQRIDGVLQENILKENKIASAMVLRLKLMAGLDISEKRLPQDGRFNLQIKGHNIDVRMSTMPVQHGESVVMRLLDQSAGLLSLDQTGMPADLVARVRHQITRPHGMVLVTGPTGSGKTTTLYGALSELNQSTKKIITVEDPVEYRLPRINQVQVAPKINLNFSTVLRTALRQDPDIIMVGEMRDHETVEIGLRGALTGHLVLSTLHTNDAITSALRLIDMGAAGFLVGSSLRAVIAQRLVRKICEHCGEDHTPDSQEMMWLTHLAGDEAATVTYKKGRGCQSCQYSGYKGRIGVFELLEMNEPMMAALKRDDPEAFTELAKANPTFTPLAQAAFSYAKQGVISVEEVLRLVDTIDVQG
ncbi:MULTISPECIES: GspE/PulE family protein [unclassified Colwellia]|uniref:GspE/PulE family protein n=1 Tax=unclassified Colwellia TaxID=196834 RepID=UPI0015F6FB70|nr:MULTISPECIES: GspE/PulE family protein [unclassified Colwellia]MBA6232102.1 Flp pilus assembly complex ATPase component TadA [Colwellia sp. MB02u-7]MBA6237200.1 Flp pilus assembly complex ATPase component TadA [Colwellia sp. MB02u-11]MBA6257368.1 Flp pilus assembly complex ATPase component TadA [Colwellia sp. MB3u-28]MBA6260440.1 Flp pilus assembly complex ATPase component TadA [Colwellia sp. MB3u-41]MBA6301536.1 Flp pilus assembly complex ATPase component TadA [Colwellia sp. MB3u-22]